MRHQNGLAVLEVHDNGDDPAPMMQSTSGDEGGEGCTPY